MSQRALIIGSDRDYCHVIKEFLELRELHVTVVLDYKDGVDRLSYEKPDLTIIENFGGELSPALIDSINTENEFEIVDFVNKRGAGKDRKRILVLKDRNHITFLFNFLKLNYSDTKAAEASRDSEDKGSLSSTFYPSLLIDIYSKKRTGILSINSSANLHIYFVNGSPIFAEGGDFETAIGRILIESGKITRENYEKALELAGEKKQKFGETLFEMGLISPHELNRYLELQMEEKIVMGFYYLSGEYAFNSGDSFTDRLVSYRVNLPKVIHEGVVRYIDAEPIEKENPTIEISPQLRDGINNLGLKPKELRFVQLMKNNSSVKEILDTTTLEKDETLKLLYFLALFKLLAISDISIDSIGRAAMERRLKERDILPESGKKEILLQFDEQGLSAEERDAETQPDFPDKSGEVSAGGEDSQLPGGTGYGEESPVEADTDLELEDFEFLHNRGADISEKETYEPPRAILPEDVKNETASEDHPEPETEREEIFSHIIDHDRSGNTEEEPAAEDAEGEFEDVVPARPDGPETDNTYDAGGESELDHTDHTGREQESSDNTNDLSQTYTEDPAASPSVSEEKAGQETAKTHDPREVAERVTEFYAQIRKQNHYEVLGVGRDASSKEIRDAYYRLVKFYHPDVNPHADNEIREKAEEIFTRITSAYETLIETGKREEYDSQAELAELKTNAKYIYEAEMAFKKGITLLIQRNYSGAEKKIREAVDTNPEEAAYLGAHAWTLFLSAEEKPRIEEEAIKSLEKAISMNDQIPENFYYLGSIHKHRNDLAKAEEYFNKALRLDPDYIEVKREIRLLNTRKANSRNEKKPEQSFWSALFKK